MMVCTEWLLGSVGSASVVASAVVLLRFPVQCLYLLAILRILGVGSSLS